MKKLTSIFIFLVAVAFVFTQIYAGGGGAANKFEHMKKLAGNWEGKRPDGVNVKVSYEVVSNGSAIMERLAPDDEPNMITMYHLDGDKLMMTHYCSAMNQPRMVAADGGGDNIASFVTKDVTNLTDESPGHMVAMQLTIKDEDHIVHKWTFKEGDKEHAAPFEFSRVKMSEK